MRSYSAWVEPLQTLAIGFVGAALFWAIGFPAAALTGPAAAVSLATLLGVRTAMPPVLRDTVFVLIGISIGSTVTPEVVATALAWPLSLLVLTVTLAVVIVAARAALIRGFGYDRLTAILCATPGHLSYVLSLSADLKADVARVALVQTVRVLMLTLLVPVLIAFWGVEGTATLGLQGPITPMALAATFALSLVVGLVFKRLGVPAPLLIAAMTVSAVGHGASLTPGAVPAQMTILAFICMGSLIGTRFRGIDRRGLLGAFAAGLVMTVIACVVASLGAIMAAEIVGLPPAALLLAFAPGGVEIMAAIAIETGLEPAFVAAHHVFRLAVLGVFIPILVMRSR
jgi:uncharacterized protein